MLLSKRERPITALKFLHSTSPIAKTLVFNLFIAPMRLLRYPYTTHIFCNAGLGAFEGIAWGILAKQFATNLLEALTYPAYKLQRSGVTTGDGLGWVWQCNLFGHYLMVRLLPRTFIYPGPRKGQHFCLVVL